AAAIARRQLATAGLDTAFGSNDYADLRAKAEQTALESLTRGFDDQYAKEKQEYEQSLYNRGYRPDQSQYMEMMKDFEQRWSDKRLDAQRAAFQEGGAEFERMFGADLKTRDQRVSELGELNKVGSGVRDPGFFGLSPVQVAN